MKLCPTGCGRNARPVHLLCGPCWALVPKPLQVEVYRTWDDYRRASLIKAHAKIISALAAYRKASDAAIAAAR